MCQAVRAPGSKLTVVALSRAGASFSMIGVWLTRPVNYRSDAISVGTLPQGMIFISVLLENFSVALVCHMRAAVTYFPCPACEPV